MHEEHLGSCMMVMEQLLPGRDFTVCYCMKETVTSEFETLHEHIAQFTNTTHSILHITTNMVSLAD